MEDEIISSREYHVKEAIRQAEEFLKLRGVTEENAHEWEGEFIDENNTITLTVRKKQGF
jgi:hypothetical protein